MKKNSSHKLEWTDIGAVTVPHVAEIKKHQPLTWHYMMEIARPESRSRANDPLTCNPLLMVPLYKGVHTCHIVTQLHTKQ
jgi:hypothetical protein